MRTTFFVPLILTIAAVEASPVLDEAHSIHDKKANLETRQPASGCYHFASPTCCVPGVCMCRNGWIYLINRDQLNSGGHGCDPPWGFIATSYTGHPQSCCRIATDGAIVKESDDGIEIVETSPLDI